VDVTKTLTFTPNSHIILDYHLVNHSPKETKLKFGIEFNFSMLAGNAHDRYYVTSESANAGRLATIAHHRQLEHAGLVDEWTGISVRLNFDRPTDVWTCPVETVSLSEGGFERIYQSSCIVPVWDIKIPAGDKWHARIIQEITPRHRKE
jgi:alpha-amylase